MIYIFILIIILFLLTKQYKILDNFEDIENKIENELDNSIVNDIVSNEEQDVNCHIYGCNSSKTQTHSIFFIGNDDKNNLIFSLNNNYYSIDNDKIIKSDIKEENIIKNEDTVMIPINKNNKINIKPKFENYTLLGYLKNNYYNNKYLVYYKKIMNSLYEYIIVNIENDNYVLKYVLPPRQKIYNEEIIFIEENRTLRLGPFIFTNKI